MEITINGEKRAIENSETTLAALLVLQGVESPEMVSVQRNGEFVDKSLYESTSLEQGDEVEFVYFMGGGRVEARHPWRRPGTGPSLSGGR